MTVVTPDIFRATIQKYVGCGYGFCDRCGGGCHPCQFDCSGLQCKGTNETGLTRNVCTSSFVLAQQCYDLGLLVSFEEADDLDGVWFIRGDDLGRVDNGSKSNGASGHIVYRVRWVNPDTGVITWYTIEAKGRRYGVVNGTTYGRVWDAAYKIPGMDYSPPAPPTPTIRKKEPDMVYLPGGTADARWAASLSPNGVVVFLWNGLRVRGMEGSHHQGDPSNCMRWTPRNENGSNAATPEQPLRGLAKTDNNQYLFVINFFGAGYNAEIL